MQTMQIISPWQTKVAGAPVAQGQAGKRLARKFAGGEGNPLLRWWMDPSGMEPFVLGPHDEQRDTVWDPDQADSTWRLRTWRITTFKTMHTLAITGAARFLGSSAGWGWEVGMLALTNGISLANVGRNHWHGLRVFGPQNHAQWSLTWAVHEPRPKLTAEGDLGEL